jgi:hypothetical protein
VLIGLAIAIADVVTDGWYGFYAFVMPASHESIPEMVTGFWRNEIFGEMPIPVVFGAYFATVARGGATRRRFAHVLFAGSLLVMAYATRVHSGSFLNDKMPAHAALAILLGLGVAAFTDAAANGADLADLQRRRLFAYGLVLCQLAVLDYPMKRWIPGDDDVAEGRAFDRTVASFPGEVLLTQHGHWTRHVDKPIFAHGMAVFDVARMTQDAYGAKERLRDSFESALHSQRFSAIFTDDGLVMPDLIERYYVRSNRPFIENKHALIPKTGPHYRPRQLYVPRR